MRCACRPLLAVALVAFLGCGGHSANTSDGGHDGGAGIEAGSPLLDGGAGRPDVGGPGADGGDGLPDAGGPEADGGGVHDAMRSMDGGNADAETGVGPYGSNGPDTVTTSSFMVTAGDTFTTTAYIPSGAGPFPVVILSSGFEQPGAAYAPYASRLASWGITTFLRDDPGVFSNLTAVDLASDVSYMVTSWLAATNADASSALSGKVTTSRIGLAGHSRGGQVALLAGEMGAIGKIQGVFGLDPVDTAVGSVEARTTIGSLGVPIAFIGETTDSTGGVGGMPCAPAADNFQVLFQAASSPAVAISAVNADHTMFEAPSSCQFCTLCTAGTANQPDVLAMSVRYLTAFFARQLLGDTTVGATFAGAGATEDLTAGAIQLVSK